MKQLSRLVWSEGMYLAPHHFQAQARYFEDAVHFVSSALWFAGYGLAGCELDEEALHNGTVSLVHARGIFPDGLVFHMPECDPLPEPRNITELFSPVADRLTVHLGIPRHRPEGANCAPADAQSDANVRYRAGHFVYDPEFIPPCVRITASQRLLEILRRLIDILSEKSATLSRSPAEGGEMAAAFSRHEVAGFWFLHCVNSALVALRNLCYSKRGHPEEVFIELSRLAGSLCTFGLDTDPAKLPLYDHDHLGECFGALDEQIRFQLETVIPTNCVSIPLQPVRNYFYEGPVSDQRCLGRSRWIFSVRAELGEADLITKAPQLIKVCSAGFIAKLVQRALPGLTLTHLPVPPAAVSPRVDHQYFSVTRAGPCWDHIVQTRRVGVYVPGELPKPEVGLHVVLES